MSTCVKVSHKDIEKILTSLSDQYNLDHSASLSHSEQQTLNDVCDVLEDTFNKLGHTFNREGFSDMARRLYPKGKTSRLFGGVSESKSNSKSKSKSKSNSKSKSKSKSNELVVVNNSRRASFSIRKYDFYVLLALLMSILFIYLAHAEAFKITENVKSHELFPLLQQISNEVSGKISGIPGVGAGVGWLRSISKVIEHFSCVNNIRSATSDIILRVVTESFGKLSEEVGRKCISNVVAIDTNIAGDTWVPLIDMINRGVSVAYNRVTDPTGSMLMSCSMRTTKQLIDANYLKITDIIHVSSDGASRVYNLLAAAFACGVPALNYIAYRSISAYRARTARRIK